MITIRDEQMAVLRADAEERSTESRIRELPRSLRAIHPRRCESLDEAEVEAWVHEAIEVARSHGFTRFDELARYVHLTFVAGHRDLHARDGCGWVRAILSWEEEPEVRLSALETRARKEFA